MMVLRQSYIIYGILILSLFIVSCSSDNSSTSSQQTKQQNCVDVQVPYTEQEPYNEQEAYSEVECNQLPYNYDKQITNCKSSLLVLGDARISCTIYNKESQAGIFSVKNKLQCDDGQWFTSESSAPIQAYSTNEFSGKALSFCSVKSCDCEVTPPTKQVCNPVTKYHTVTKYRQVTNYKTEQRCD